MPLATTNSAEPRADDGVSVMVSSHLLGEIDKTATVLGILSNGRMIFQGTRDELLAASMPDVMITCSEPRRAASLLNHADARLVDDHQVAVPGLGDTGTAGVVATLVGDGIGIHEVRRHEQTLEDVFMGLTDGGGL